MSKEGEPNFGLTRYDKDGGNNGGGESNNPGDTLSRIIVSRQRQQVLDSSATTKFVIRPNGVDIRTVRDATPLEIQKAAQAGQRDFSIRQSWNTQPEVAQPTRESTVGKGHNNGSKKNRFATQWQGTTDEPKQLDEPKRQIKTESDSSTQEKKPQRHKGTKAQRVQENGKRRRERSGGGQNGSGRNFPEHMGRKTPKSRRIR